MIKTFFLTPGCFDKGGISRYSRYQIDALRSIHKPGELWVASLMGKTTDSFEDSFEVDYAGKNNSKWQQIKFAIIFVVNAILKQPKIVHVAHVNFSGLAVFVSRLIGAKTILNVYGLEVWSGLSKDASWGLHNVHYIISDCHNTKDYLVNNNIRNENEITVIWDCVDLNKFKPASSEDLRYLSKTYGIPEKGERTVVLTLGRIAKAAKHKGYHRLLKAFAGMDQSRYSLVFAGKGDMVDELKNLTSDLGIQDNVFFTGMIHENDMASIYSYGDIFSLVSEVGDQMGEGIPLTPIEAMACGTPIVVGDMDGSREAIIDKNGICIESHNEDALQDAITTIANDLGAYETAAYTVAREVFSYGEFKNKHQAFYAGIDK